MWFYGSVNPTSETPPVPGLRGLCVWVCFSLLMAVAVVNLILLCFLGVENRECKYV